MPVCCPRSPGKQAIVYIYVHAEYQDARKCLSSARITTSVNRVYLVLIIHRMFVVMIQLTIISQAQTVSIEIYLGTLYVLG